MMSCDHCASKQTPLTNLVRRSISVAACLLISALFAGPLVADEPPPSGAHASTVAATSASPVSPADSLQHFELSQDLEIQLVAAEPEVVDPVAIRFDEDGRLWVVEMRDYPKGPPPGEKPLSRIRVLTDRDDDGYYESAVTFADELLFATGVQPWRGGAFATLSGKVLYLKDADGDGRADKQQTWFHGFAEDNPQLRANHPTLGFDGRIYIAGGLRGGRIVDDRRNNATPVSISGRDFAFDPRGDEFEAVSGNGQYGLALDDFGHRFVCMNRRAVDLVALEEHHVRRNPHAAITATVKPLVPEGDGRRLFPRVTQWTTAASHEGQFTAACGVHIYRGEALPAAYRGNAFTCEPTASLVHREIVEPDGATLKARPADEGREFLASRDPWFRPVDLVGGPDGALYVVDMYRAVIEHPEWVPPEDRNPKNLREGDDRGRIYRIVAKEWKRPMQPKLSRASTHELVELLGERSDGWWQDTLARLLIERQDKNSIDALKALQPKSPIAQARVLAVLRALDALDDERLAAGLRDADARVREYAAMLSFARVAKTAMLQSEILRAAHDTDPRVRFQAALALGNMKEAEAAKALYQLVLSDGADLWSRRAILSSAGPHAVGILQSLLNEPATERKSDIEGFARTIAQVVAGRNNPDEAVASLEQLLADRPGETTAVELEILLGLAEGVARQNNSLAKLVAKTDKPTASLIGRLEAAFASCRRLAGDASATEDERKLAIQLLVHDSGDPTKALTACLDDRLPGIRQEAIRGLARRDSTEALWQVLERFAMLTPQLRRTFVELMLNDRKLTSLLLDAVEQGHVRPADLETMYVKRLREQSSPEIRNRARKLLQASVQGDRAAILAKYRQALTPAPTSPDANHASARAKNGLELYTKHCAVCHRIGNIGGDVGPNLSDSRLKTAEQLLTAILEPSEAVDANYVAYIATAEDGLSYTGVVAEESAAALTLRQADGKSVTLLRSALESLESTGQSLMPEGFERSISPAEMTDLITYLRNWRTME